MSLATLLSLMRAFVRIRNGAPVIEENVDFLLSGRDCSRDLSAIVSPGHEAWAYILARLLFGLGFDTRWRSVPLGISAASATQGLPIRSILVFPASLTAGMTPLDTNDSILVRDAEAGPSSDRCASSTTT